MATIDEHLAYLKDDIRFPKINKNVVNDPKHQFSGAEYNRIIDTIDQVGTDAKNAILLAKQAAEEGIETVAQPFFFMRDDVFDSLVATGSLLQNGVYCTYEEEIGEGSAAVYDDVSGYISKGGAAYDEVSGYITLPSAAYDEASGYLTI